jgi:hypothetical protein
MGKKILERGWKTTQRHLQMMISAISLFLLITAISKIEVTIINIMIMVKMLKERLLTKKEQKRH